MYARPLFVVVGISGAVLFSLIGALLRNCALASPEPIGYTLAS
jgi:hypothetical protein